MTDRSKIRYTPYHNRISDQTLLQCGIRPSSMNGACYEFAHPVKTNDIVIRKETIYNLPINKTDEFITPKIDIAKKDILENEVKIKWIIQKLNAEKDKLEYTKSKGYLIDCFKNVKMPIFLNRASIKLLNINYVFHGKIKNAIDSKFCNFADVCCAPGGFTYLIKKTNPKSPVTSHMFTMPDVGSYLKMDVRVLKLKNIFITYGDITLKSDRDDFACNIVVDFMLADGGIDFSGRENEQEVISKNLYVSQLLLGLKIVKEGGFIVCKFFDMFTRFSTCLLYSLSFCFDSIEICKLMSSKAGNSERYILFDGYKVNTEIIELFESINDKLNSKENVTSFADTNDCRYRKFANYLTTINKSLANTQLTALQKYTGKIEIPPENVKACNNTGYLHCKKWQTYIKK
ncbi:methyltransferase [Penaeus monodon nudivirus]|uniref:Methyltransferase n=1 Tax=Penaeus monodon nudivirus TaxID=1529056 RepID=A0A076FEI0_9VIRU|nr:methyltransferase [Penaeus monodon nudivirus]AII15794.1 methyltransferase [Penaeus monodon nudivirus]